MSLPEPKGRQREVVYLPAKGHTCVLGTAGSGKSTMAVHRANYLSLLSQEKVGKVLLVTFNKALLSYLNALAEGQGIPRNLEIRNYHHFARGYLNSKERMKQNAIVSEVERLQMLTQILEQIKTEQGELEFLNHPAEFFAEECKWIGGCRIDNVSDYADLRRQSGGKNLTIEESNLIFTIYQRYKLLRQESQYFYDWDDIAQAVEDEFLHDQTPRYYRHVVIDEGQDFTPAMLRSLALAIPDDGSLTFFGDMAQQIYGNRISWRDAGLQLTQPWIFKENYRNTTQIANLAIAMTRMSTFQGMVDLVLPNNSRVDGPLPTIVRFESEDAEKQLVIQQAKKLAPNQSVAILVRRRDQEKFYLEALSAQRLHRDLHHWCSSGISVGTYHAAKGFEFDMVILPQCNADTLPDQQRLLSFSDRVEGVAQEARLLYVGVTRARRGVLITYVGELTSLLPSDDFLYKWLER